MLELVSAELKVFLQQIALNFLLAYLFLQVRFIMCNVLLFCNPPVSRGGTQLELNMEDILIFITTYLLLS